MDVSPPTPETLEKALRILRQGGVIAHATETCYGLACDLTNQQAVQKLFRMKQRPLDAPVSALFSSVHASRAFVEWSKEAEALGERYLPGPLTIILPLRNNSGLYPTPSGGSTLGIRISPHPVAMMLAEQFGKPLSTTSANIHGKPNPYSMQEMQEQFGRQAEQPDLLIDSGILEQRDASTVVDCSSGALHVLRGTFSQ